MSDPCKPEAGVLRPVIDHARCEGKRECVKVCPHDVFEVRRIDDADFKPLGVLAKLKVIAHRRQTAYAPRAADCHSCGLCVTACPEKAIKLAAVVLVFALAAACGGGDDVPAFDAGPADAAPSCGVTWELRIAHATQLTVLDAEPGAEGRTARIGVTFDLGGCEEPATMMLEYGLEGDLISIAPRVWHPVGLDCPVAESESVTLPLVFDDLRATTWMFSSLGADPLTVEVSPTSLVCDTSRTACALDCDCDVDAGERCLSYGSFAGPTTACAVPCELDRDCGGTRCEGEISDGLGHVCTTDLECGAGRACPDGWTCDAGACTPDFTLNQGTRHACACDAECDAGLRCTSGHCEALCQSDGAWCQGAHACGDEYHASEQTLVESICVWLGE